MSPDQTQQVMVFIATMWPNLRWEDGTPQAWAMVLQHYRFEDAKEAVAELAGERDRVHVSDVVQRIKKIRAEKLKGLPEPQPPADLDPDDSEAWLRWLRGARDAQLAELDAGRPVLALPASRVS